MELDARLRLLLTLSSHSPGGLHGTCCPLPSGLSKQACQVCMIAVVTWKKRLCMLSTTQSGFTHFGVMSGSGQSIPNS